MPLLPFLLSPALSRDSQARSRPDEMVRIAAVGDVMLARSVGKWSRRESDYGYPFRKIRGVLADYDLVFCNLECALTRQDTRVQKGFTFKADPKTAQHLKEAGFNVVSLANNHAVDFGKAGFAETVSNLARLGLPASGIADGKGTQAPVLTEVRGLCIGWLAYCSPGIDPYFSRTEQGRAPIAMYRSKKTQEEIRAVRKSVDILIVSLHFGREYSNSPTKTQARIVREVARSGASIVLGHHQHVVQGMEIRGKTLIAHGLGNFVFDQKTPDRNESIILEIEAGKSGVRRAAVRPVVITQGQPSLATGEKAAAILQRFSQLSGELRTGLRISNCPEKGPSAELAL